MERHAVLDVRRLEGAGPAFAGDAFEVVVAVDIIDLPNFVDDRAYIGLLLEHNLAYMVLDFVQFLRQIHMNNVADDLEPGRRILFSESFEASVLPSLAHDELFYCLVNIELVEA